MTYYKLVPSEPTQEMVSAAEDAYMPFGDMDLALRMAILASPAVQGGEPDVARHDAMRFALSEMVKWYENISLGNNPAFQYYNLAKKALLSAAPPPAEQQSAPDVQGEPVAYAVLVDNGNIRIWSADPSQAEALRLAYGDQVRPLYAAPQPAEQQSAVTKLVEALERINDMDSMSYHSLESAKIVARNALAAYSALMGEAACEERNGGWTDDAIKGAAPTVRGVPVGRVKTVGGYPDESEHTVEWLCKYKDLKDGDLLYTAPQPAEQVENSEDLEALHNNLDDAGTPRHDSSGIEYSAWGRVIQYAKAVAPHPAPDVDALVESLERLVGDVERATHVELGGTPWLKEKMAEIDYARAALAAYRKGAKS